MSELDGQGQSDTMIRSICEIAVASSNLLQREITFKYIDCLRLPAIFLKLNSLRIPTRSRGSGTRKAQRIIFKKRILKIHIYQTRYGLGPEGTV